MVVADDVEAETAALGILARQADIRPTELVSHLYSLRNADAMRHLFRVTAGLDAMIVGEAEIQGQVKRAYELALVENTTSAFMNRLFREALGAGKRVRTETAIGSGAVSVSTVAVQLAQETLGDLSGRRVVVIGAGETGELTARELTERGVSSVFVANRHYDRAIGLAHRFGGQAVRFEALPAELEQADIVVSTTGSPHHIIEHDELEAVMAARRGRPLLLVDIAVPRDIDPVVREIEGVHLRDIDDLQRMVERKLSGLDAEARRAEALLEHELGRFQRWLGTLDVVPTIAAMHERGEEIARQVLAENSGRWESLSETDRERLAVVASAIVKRLLHQPTLNLKARGEDQRTYAYVQALRELFGLEVRERSAFDALPPAEPERRPAGGAEVTAIRSRRRRQRR
jgi:glutamyl-tRNA reductase